MAIERFRPSVPAKAKVTHSTPEVTLRRVGRSSSRAKLKIRITSRAKTSMAESSSRLRSSAARSFQTTARIAFRKPATRDGCFCFSSVAAAGTVRDFFISACQRLSVKIEQVLAAQPGGVVEAAITPPASTSKREARSCTRARSWEVITTVRPRAGDFAQDLVQHVAGILVQAGIGLVEEQHLRIVQHGPADGQALLHAARESAHQVVTPGRQAHQLQHLPNPFTQLGHAVHASVKAQVLLGGQIAVQAAAGD